MKKNILILLPFSKGKGASGRKEEAIDSMIQAHNNLGYEVNLVSTSPESYDDNEIYLRLNRIERFFAGILLSFYVSRVVNRVVEVLWMLLMFLPIKRYNSDSSISFILSFSMTNKPSIYALLINRLLGIPYFINEHRSIFQRKYQFSKIPIHERFALKYSQGIISLTENQKEILKKLEIYNVSVAPLVLQNEFYRNNEPNNSKSTERLVLGGWANWRKLKRLDIIFELHEFLLENNIDNELRIAGPLSDYKYLHSKFDNVNSFYLGDLSRVQIKKLANDTDIYLLVSEHETFGIPVTEATAGGALSLITECGGPESLIPEDFCRVVPVNDIAKMKMSLLELVSISNRHDRESSISFAKGNFTIEALTNKLDDIYEMYQ